MTAMYDFFFGSGTGHSFMLLSLVIGLGLLLGKIQFKGISLGAMWILYIGLLFSGLGMHADPNLLHFIKEFGLILFVFSIGLQVGPGFVNSFRKGGLGTSLVAVGIILLTVLTTLLFSWLTPEDDLPTLSGIMTGAVTCTPGLAAVQQTYYDLSFGTFLSETDLTGLGASIASGYALAYPIGMLGVMLVLVCLEKLFRVDISAEKARMDDLVRSDDDTAEVTLTVCNPAVIGKRPSDVLRPFEGTFVVRQIVRGGTAFPTDRSTLLEEGDRLVLVAPEKDIPTARMVFGAMAAEDVEDVPANQPTSRLIVSSSKVEGKRLKDLRLPEQYGVTVTTVLRSNVEIVANRNLALQVGDTLAVVGPQEGIDALSTLLGNSARNLEKPNLLPIFLGIVLGLTLGYIPLRFGNIPHPFRLGLAAGPFIVALLLGYFGPKWKITTYNTYSATSMLRELGLCLLMAAIGLSSGEAFVSSFLQNGWQWILYGAAITIIPVLVAGLVARWVFKMNFYMICGMLSGVATNPQVLRFAQTRYGKYGYISYAYSAVYPMAMFLWIVAAQLMITFYFL